MANVMIDDTNLTEIANAIRGQNGLTTKYKPSEMAAAIRAIEGSSTVEIPNEAFNNDIGGNHYRFYGRCWDWFLEMYGDQINPLNLGSHMFANNEIETIPFTIVFNGSYDWDYAFYNCQNLTGITDVTIDNDVYTGSAQPRSMAHLFDGCYKLKTLPDDLFGSGVKAKSGTQFGDRSYMFKKCYSLRKLPNLQNAMNYEDIYYGLAWGAVALDEVTDLPVSLNLAIPALSSAFIHCHRLKEMTFETNTDGTPITAYWMDSTLDLSNAVGWSNNTSYLISPMYGNFDGPEVNGNNTYHSYKNSPDWFTDHVEYSRYNKLSAINTINSLPDCSMGGNNTIKFFGTAGSATDGGAINTMTEEQIAVAAAKGWTVAYTDYLTYTTI